MGHSVVMVKEVLAPHAECLARAGFVVLAVDWRMVGSSEGEPCCQWLPQWQVDDLRAGVSYLRGRPEVDPERIGLWGHSTAAGVAIVAGAFDRRVRCVAGQNPSLLDTWTALEKSRGRNQLTAIRTVLEQDFDRRLVIGEGVTVPALPADDPKLAGYIAQSEELFPTFGNQITLASASRCCWPCSGPTACWSP
jgi:alpha-beta hydrolase superfamily lysophospholipase